MALSKKIRFEVFKRDGFQCCYCGKCPPQVVLEVDHIDPKSKGGADSIDNLITACFDCNRGKSNIPLDNVPKKISENFELIQEKEAQLIEYRKFIAKVKKRISKDVEKISVIFSGAYPGRCLSDKFKNVSIKKFIELLPIDQIEQAMFQSVSRFPKNKPDSWDNATRYFCGICWNIIKGGSR